MEKENKKIGFWARIKIAIAKLENYGIFLEEKTTVAVKYFFLMVLILAVVMGVLQTYEIMKIIKKGYQYMQNELTDFSYENGNLIFPERIFAYDEEYDVYLFADTNDTISTETLQQYKEQIKTTGLIFLKNKLIYKTAYLETEYAYQDLANQYGISTLNKTQLLEKMATIGMTGIKMTLFLAITISIYMVQLLATFMDWLILSIFAFITARVCRMNLTLKHCFNLSIYALTLSIFFSMIYDIAYTIFGFYTEYFRLVYLLISYVYVVAVILILKSDLLKQQVEIAKIVEVQKEVHEESNLPEDKKEEKEKNDEEKNPKTDENKTNDEPDGSEI